MYATIHPQRLYERIVDQIQQRIVAGELKVGDQLPAERELAEQFGVSRIAVREAVKALREKGLVQVRPGKGTFIADRTSRAVRHSLDLMMKIGSADGFANLVEVREILEPEIAALAAPRITSEQIVTLRQALEKMDAAMKDADAFIQADLDFHIALAEGTQNPLVPALMDSIIEPLREQRTRIFRRGGAARGQYHHRRIFNAVMRREANAARQAMRQHMRQIRQDSQMPARPKLESRRP